MKAACLPFIALLFSSCISEDDLGIEDIKLIENIPVVTNIPNVFTYTIYANEMDDELLSPLNFDTTALILSVSIYNQEAGTFSFDIYENDSTVAFHREISSSMVLTEFPVFKPSKLQLELSDFSGSIEFTLTTE